MIKMVLHEDAWVASEGRSITLEVPLKEMVSATAEALAKIAKGHDGNPVRLYAVATLASLNLLSYALTEEDVLSVKELLYQPKPRKDGRSILVEDTVVGFMATRDKWVGTHTQLLSALKDMVPLRLRKLEEWPKSANGLSYRLKQSKDTLSKKGIEMLRSKTSAKRTVTLERSQ